MIPLAGLILLVQAVAAPVQAPTVTVRRTPEQPAIGEAITIELRVRAPAGTLVRFPVLPDTGTRIEPLDPRVIRDNSTRTELDQVAVYRLIAWDTGAVRVPFGDITLTRDGAERRYPVVLPDFAIRSLLPPDTSKRVPRPARDLIEEPTARWRLWVALAVILVLAVWGWRRFRRARAAARTPRGDAATRARDGFAHGAALGLVAAGEHGRHALVHVQVLRRYLAERWPAARVDLTASELAAQLPAADFPILPERVVALAARAEAVAYARAAIAASDAEAIAQEAQRIVSDLERVWQARREQAEANAPRRIRRKPL